ncbi:MAG: cation:proton antiporter [Gammaproteobacteria bacterium]|nr:cation:proton antiporter [Gammaproteobacteria bacterium]MDH4253651.1 cation:proton antiporter [Gammaproteobacteria bacterium]MDH5309767.1 cation:proton antiporter [Gammaproteobacteria bacterium]
MTLLILGLLFLFGVIADLLAIHIGLPRVTLLVIAGLLVGPVGINLIPADMVSTWFPVLTDCALSMVGFLLGHQLSPTAFKKRGKKVIALATSKVLASAILVLFALVLLGYPLALALMLAGISTATAPAATFDVVRESGATGSFVETLLDIVAVDDALGLIAFALLLAAALGLSGEGGAASILVDGLSEVGGSLLVGAGLGVPMAFLSVRFGAEPRAAELIQAMAFGFVFVCAGASIMLDLSPILASIAMGSTVTSIARSQRRPFNAVERVEWPFIILFFMLAGASLDVHALESVGVLVLLYVVARAAGSWLGIYAAAGVLSLDHLTRNWMGLALMPQAGVALGMALMAAQTMPQFADAILTTVLASTVLLELGSPILTRLVVRRATQKF